MRRLIVDSVEMFGNDVERGCPGLLGCSVDKQKMERNMSRLICILKVRR